METLINLLNEDPKQFLNILGQTVIIMAASIGIIFIAAVLN